MPTTRAVARKQRTRVRAVRRITWKVVLLVGSLRAFFTSERDNQAAEMLEQPADRTAAATGLSRSTVIRIANGEYADTRPLSKKREHLVSNRRVPASELSRVQGTVYTQYEDNTVPTLDSTLALLEEGAGEGDDLSDYKWSRSTLHRAMTDLGFNFTRGPNHYDVAREKRSIVKQRENFTKKMREYRADGRTIFYTGETWANKNMTPRRIWTDKSSRARPNVPSGKKALIIIAYVGSRKTGLVPGASLVFKGKKKTGDYHGEMNSAVWLKWLQDQVLPKIGGGVLVVDRAPYHMKLTGESRPDNSSMKKSQLADWLEEHDAAPTNWPPTWRQDRVANACPGRQASPDTTLLGARLGGGV